MTDQRIAERQRLQALYRSMLTEELLDLYGQGDLTPVAYDVLSEVLSERGVTKEQQTGIAAEFKAGNDSAPPDYLADFGSRCVARLFDVGTALVLGTIGALAVMPFTSVSRPVGAAVGLLYAVFADGLPGGQSVGKRVLDIAVVDVKSRKPCSYWQSLQRNVSLLLLCGLDVLPAFGQRRQRWGDAVAGTEVVQALAARSEH